MPGATAVGSRRTPKMRWASHSPRCPEAIGRPIIAEIRSSSPGSLGQVAGGDRRLVDDDAQGFQVGRVETELSGDGLAEHHRGGADLAQPAEQVDEQRLAAWGVIARQGGRLVRGRGA
jgi:hypothetical protein